MGEKTCKSNAKRKYVNPDLTVTNTERGWDYHFSSIDDVTDTDHGQKKWKSVTCAVA